MPQWCAVVGPVEGGVKMGQIDGWPNYFRSPIEGLDPWRYFDVVWLVAARFEEDDEGVWRGRDPSSCAAAAVKDGRQQLALGWVAKLRAAEPIVRKMDLDEIKGHLAYAALEEALKG